MFAVGGTRDQPFVIGAKAGALPTVDYVWYVWKKGADGKIGFEQL
jgi:hypothetical protein